MSDQIFLTGIAGFGYHGLFDHSKVLVATVTVHKPQAPVDAVLKDIAVQVTRKR